MKEIALLIIGVYQQPAWDSGRERGCRWGTQRETIRRVGQHMMGNLPFLLGGELVQDGPRQAPNLQVVQETVKFAMAIGKIGLRWETESKNTTYYRLT
jgi:hypothetical protein